MMMLINKRNFEGQIDNFKDILTLRGNTNSHQF